MFIFRVAHCITSTVRHPNNLTSAFTGKRINPSLVMVLFDSNPHKADKQVYLLSRASSLISPSQPTRESLCSSNSLLCSSRASQSCGLLSAVLLTKTFPLPLSIDYPTDTPTCTTFLGTLAKIPSMRQMQVRSSHTRRPLSKES